MRSLIVSVDLLFDTNSFIMNGMEHKLTRIKERLCLTNGDSEKLIYHIVVDLEGTGLRYEVGDCLSILPINPPFLVDHTLKALAADGTEEVCDRENRSYPLRTFLERKANLREFSRRLIAELATREPNQEKKNQLDLWLSDREALKEMQHRYELWDLLAAFHGTHLSPQELCDLSMPLLPRFYSIASSMRVVGEEAHLTIALHQDEGIQPVRLGVCSYHLCCGLPVGESALLVAIHPHNGFTLPADPTIPIIMIGAGTGVAPYRGFMQERVLGGRSAPNWLFFGERHQATHFLYGSYWKELEERGQLRLELAFSRDQEEKVYVQHRLRACGQELFDWLERGAALFVCGDAKQMAKAVDATLVEIIAQYSGGDGKEYLKELKRQGRYLRDVY